MQRVSGANFLANAFGAGKNGYQDYNPSNGQAGTTPNASAFNALQEEIASYIEGQGIALNANDNTQLAQAITHYVNTAVVGAIANLENPQQVGSAITAALAGYAPIASPAFTGSPTAPTPAAGDNSTRLATTAFTSGNFAPLTAFSNSLAASGYQRLPNGLLLQFGLFSISAGSNRTTASITFPIAFPTGILTVVANGRGPANGATWGPITTMPDPNSFTATGCSIICDTANNNDYFSSGVTGNYIVLGK